MQITSISAFFMMTHLTILIINKKFLILLITGALLVSYVFIVDEDSYRCTLFKEIDYSKVNFIDKDYLTKESFLCERRRTSPDIIDSLYNEYIIFPRKYGKGEILINEKEKIFYLVRRHRSFCVSSAISGRIHIEGAFQKRIEFYNMKMKLSKNDEHKSCSNLTGFTFINPKP